MLVLWWTLARVFTAQAVAVLIIACGQWAYASSIVAIEEIDSRLRDKGEYPIEILCKSVCKSEKQECSKWSSSPPNYFDGNEGRNERNGKYDKWCVEKKMTCTKTENVCDPSPTMGYLKAESITATIKNLEYGEIQRIGLDDTWYRQSLTIPNCTSQDQGASKVLGFSYTQSQTISVTKSVSTNSGISLTIGGHFKVPGFGGNASATYKISDTISASERKSETKSESINVTTNATIRAAPHKETSMVLNLFTREFRLPFIATIVVDGPIKKNLSGYSMVSDILSENDRSLSIEGNMEAILGSEEWIEYREAEIDCQNRSGYQVILSMPQQFLHPENPTSQQANILAPTVDGFGDGTDSILGLSYEDFLSRALESATRKRDQGIMFPGVLAEGQHQCQSIDSIGHVCTNFGYFSDCFEAQSSLEAEDCCFSTPDEGTSIGFVLQSCSPF